MKINYQADLKRVLDKTPLFFYFKDRLSEVLVNRYY